MFDSEQRREAVDRLLAEHRELTARLSDPAVHQDPALARRLNRRFAELGAVVTAHRAWSAAAEELADARELAAAGDDDAAAFAAEVPGLEAAETEAAERLRRLLIPRDPDDARDVILEIKGGEGGEEAALFAGDLLRMYLRYAESRGWKTEVLSATHSDLGGYKDVHVAVRGSAAAPVDGVYARLKFEGGVHRVQRVPATETQGRIHTSAATVAVLPSPEEVDVQIDPGDLRIDTYRSSGAGGQHVNKTDSAVRITHLPTGIVVTSSEKSQHQNRAKAMKVLQVRLYDMQREAMDSARAESRKAQVGSGDRSERIRTYNFPQGRVTDHRINLTLYKLDRIVAGDDLGEVIDALIAEDQAKKLAALDGAAA